MEPEPSVTLRCHQTWQAWKSTRFIGGSIGKSSINSAFSIAMFDCQIVCGNVYPTGCSNMACWKIVHSENTSRWCSDSKPNESSGFPSLPRLMTPEGTRGEYEASYRNAKHGAGILTCKTGSSWGEMLVHIPAPWFASGLVSLIFIGADHFSFLGMVVCELLCILYS